ncbi:MAG: glycosyltransferase [Actinomycetota bacterium]|nr:glycosyltransferase [Actinomycetota bacterium]
MRIAVVSAHYPPDFVSGATLAAQRLAGGAASRGHEVSVFAGWIGGGRPELRDQRPPLFSWDESAGDGSRVRWISTAPWLGWDDPLNFDNPSLVPHFERFLAAFRPEVVHFQVLQSMGAALVPAASRAGARVVVTMHDFWWLCTRLFLVGKDLRPCSLVVSAGTCSCQVDRAWMEDRKAFLAGALRSADLVLAPSATAGAVLAANGIAEGRLEVDENGVPEGDGGEPQRPGYGSAASARPSDEPVQRVLRMSYLGGRDPLKGFDVLVEASAMLRRRQGWRLVAYGVAPCDPAEEARLAALRVQPAPAFAPEELGRVMRDSDLVVLPSIMRETFSLVTREALRFGVPVLCTDSIGPEEVVRHGHNGLVVPAGSATALASAVELLLDQPMLVDKLRAGTGSVRLRSVDDQIECLLARYRTLLQSSPAPAPPAASAPAASSPVPTSPAPAATPPPAPPTPAGLAAGGSVLGQAAPAAAVLREGPALRQVRRVLFVCGIEGAPLRYRARLPSEALGLQGISSEVRHYRDPQVGLLASEADAVVYYRVPATPDVLRVIERTRSLGAPVLFDVDDLIFDPGAASHIPALSLLPDDEARLWMEGVNRYRTTLEACDGFIGSTAMLVERASALTGLPSYRFDNGVGLVSGRDSDAALGRSRRDGPVRIGYLSGTNTHTHDWAMVEPAVLDVMRSNPSVELWLIGLIEPSQALQEMSARVRRVGPQHWRLLPQLLRDLDVNLAPLTAGSVFNEAKSAIKWLEAALVETPTVASPTIPNREAVDSGSNGVLASDLQEWASWLDRLVNDPVLRARLGSRARRDALLAWSPHLQGSRYRDILTAAVHAGSVERRSSWTAVTRDEPAEPGHALEPYPGPEAAAGHYRVELVGSAAEPVRRLAVTPADAPSWRPRIAAAARDRLPLLSSVLDRGLRTWGERGNAELLRAAVRRTRARMTASGPDRSA